MNERSPLVTAVIVTHESEGIVDRALEAARRAHEAGLLDVVVVDNASTDGTVDLVRRLHPWVRLIESPTNLGYGRGCNLGWHDAATPYVLFMNPDAVMEPDALAQLVDFMERHPKAGLAGPAIIRERGGYQKAGGLPTPWRVIANAAGFKGAPSGRVEVHPGSEPFRTDWLCGAVLLARREVLERLEGFDPRFFLYFEETDLCRRAAAVGSELWAVGAAVARHASNSSARRVRPDLKDGGCLNEHYFRSRFYYLVKHHGWIAAVLSDLAEVIFGAAHDVARAILRRPSKGDLRSRLSAPLLRLPQQIG